MVTCLLCYPTDQWVDEVVLGFLSVFSVGQKPSLIFNYNQYLSDVIQEQFLKFKAEGAFKHQSILVYLMLFYQADRFKFELRKMDDQGSPLSIIHWTCLMRRNSTILWISFYIHPCVFLAAILYQGFHQRSRRFCILQNKLKLETGIFTRIIQRFESMGVSFLPIDY